MVTVTTKGFDDDITSTDYNAILNKIQNGTDQDVNIYKIVVNSTEVITHSLAVQNITSISMSNTLTVTHTGTNKGISVTVSNATVNADNCLYLESASTASTSTLHLAYFKATAATFDRSVLELETAGIGHGLAINYTGTLADSRYALYIHSNTAQTNSSYLAYFLQDNASSTASVIGIKNDGSGENITDGTASWTQDHKLSGFASISGTTLTDETASISAGAISGVTTLSMSGTLTLSANSAAITHSGTTTLAITSTSGTVSVESVTFTGAAISGVSTIGMSGTLTLSANSANITHSGTTSLTIASTSGTVAIESVVFTGAAISGVSSISGKYAAFTVANTENNVPLTLTQNDTTNNPNTCAIINDGTGNTIDIDSNGATGRSISISHASSEHGISINHVTTAMASANGLVNINSAIEETNADGYLLRINNDHASSVNVVAYLKNDGTGQLMSLVQNGNAAHINFSGDPTPGSPADGDFWFSGTNLILRVASTSNNIAMSAGTTGGTGSAGAGKQYVEMNVGGTIFKMLHDGTV